MGGAKEGHTPRHNQSQQSQTATNAENIVRYCCHLKQTDTPLKRNALMTLIIRCFRYVTQLPTHGPHARKTSEPRYDAIVGTGGYEQKRAHAEDAARSGVPSSLWKPLAFPSNHLFASSVQVSRQSAQTTATFFSKARRIHEVLDALDT